MLIFHGLDHPGSIHPLVQINESAIHGDPGTGFETRFVNGVDKGDFSCGNCHYFVDGNACMQEDMKRMSKRPKHPNGNVVVDALDCCEYVSRVGK